MIKPCYITAIKDDDDIIYDNLRYYYGIGLRDFFIMLHCSDEKTVAEIKRFEKDYRTNIFFLEDNDYVFKQDIHLRQLSELAFKEGFNWHITTDADELLILRKHKTIQEFLSEYQDKDSLTFTWSNYSNIKSSETGNMFVDRQHRRIVPSPWTKSIAKWTEGTPLIWSVGFHFLLNTTANDVISPETAFYAHFNYRSFERWAKRFEDWAVTKHYRFEKDPNDGWQNEYRQLKTPGFIEWQWKENLDKEYGGTVIDETAFVHDPISEDKFV